MSFKPYTEKIKKKKIGICSILGRDPDPDPEPDPDPDPSSRKRIRKRIRIRIKMIRIRNTTDKYGINSINYILNINCVGQGLDMFFFYSK